MAAVFDVFKEQSYTYLQIKQSTARGDKIVSEQELLGIFKDRAGQTINSRMESVASTATLHVHPEDFSFTSCDEFIGNGVRVNGKEYAIVGATAGTNFENGQIEHYRLTLQEADFVPMEAA